MHVFDAATYTWIGNVVTTAGGAYSIDLPAGTYKLFIQPDEAGYADQWVGGTDHATADVVNLSSGNATKNVALVGPPSSHTLSGTVTAGGPGLSGASVHVFDAGHVHLDRLCRDHCRWGLQHRSAGRYVQAVHPAR